MKNNTIPQTCRLSRMFYVISPSAIIGSVLLTFFTVSGSAQSNVEDASSEVITTEAYTADVWKKTDEYSATLTSELNSTEVILGDPNLTIQQKSLYLGYQRMLTYMQSDMALKLPIENIPSDNFKKVNLEALSDPKLINMRASDFNLKFNLLVAKLLK